ncbi:MAG: RNA-binding protein, partial [Candidatus Phytoplasma sp.]|nr:RNA-binding protein [Phytoplasma sp.]
LRKKYRLGEAVNFKISYQSPIGYEGSLIANKEVVRYDDAEMILEYLRNHNNKMPYTADTNSEVIQEVFNLSRKAFKRALGYLYKERLIEFIDDETILKED